MKITFAADLRASRGQLESGGKRGTPVHAGSFLLRREMVLDEELLDQAPELMRILAHELFHFVWRRLDNATRLEWERILTGEWNAKVKGELGFSADSRKNSLSLADVKGRTRRWREYACESFCDTAAWMFSPLEEKHEEFTLSKRARPARRRWFVGLLQREKLPV